MFEACRVPLFWIPPNVYHYSGDVQLVLLYHCYSAIHYTNTESLAIANYYRFPGYIYTGSSTLVPRYWTKTINDVVGDVVELTDVLKFTPTPPPPPASPASVLQQHTALNGYNNTTNNKAHNTYLKTGQKKKQPTKPCSITWMRAYVSIG